MFLNRLYFRGSTGTLIVRNHMNDGGTNGFTSLPTIEDDFQEFAALSQYNSESVVVIELSEGEYEQDFLECISYRLNLETKELEFSYPDPNEPEIEQPYQAPLSVEVAELKQENVLLKAQNSALSERADFIEDVVAEMATQVYQ